MIYAGLFGTAIGIAAVSYSSAKDPTQAWVAARELYGLWALGLLLSAMVPGPLIFVLPWLPVKGHRYKMYDTALSPVRTHGSGNTSSFLLSRFPPEAFPPLFLPVQRFQSDRYILLHPH